MANPTHNPAANTQAARNPAPARPEPVKSDAAADRKAQLAKVAPNCDEAFIRRFDLDDDYLDGVARGEIAPPPFVPENEHTELHFRGGAWVITAKGVDPDDAVPSNR